MNKTCLNLAGLCLLLFVVVVANGAVFTVTKAADTHDGVCDSDCSLREAVFAANADSGSVKVISFAPALAGATFVLVDGELQIATTLEIRGLGADQLTISGNNASRIIYFPVGNTVTISGVTLTGGNGVGAGPVSGGSAGGGAIRAEGNLKLDEVQITGNTLLSGNFGSAVYLGSSPNLIRNSTIAHNSGYGVFVNATGSALIRNSTFASHNLAAIYFAAANVDVKNCTVIDDIYVGGLADLNLGNSIVRTVHRMSSLGGMTSAGHNIIISPDAGGNQITYSSTDLLNVNPLVSGSLQINGGKTQTLALQAGSPAIDAGDNAIAMSQGYAIDQRRYTRIVDGNGDLNATVDIGAYEFGGVPVTPVSYAGQVMDGNGNGVSRATVSVVDSEGNTRTVTTTPFGYFNVENLYVGNITVSVSAKGHRFTPAVVYMVQNVTDAKLIVQ